ncbi:S-adenosyl-L-methionine-dependent methyltransferase [Cokeromyces recurvatus]|uniref:S-adenosyl-L-methionine-dependent methyltransferase n=1 Tax=Cokeromyces recurvatus TaxID=90255 RepID=UPI00221FAB36|nr:S-adenosyl-L-methionine-dependent methyltransferase [Cokeromyces recurvatus]KAI7899510.1 S-adenosyl-L-methionine-dependent methyltransferase [Cokeromyces recurvatus]
MSSIDTHVSHSSRQSSFVKLVKHQVVLSNHAPPISSLSAVISAPIRRLSWKKSFTAILTRTSNDDDNSSSSTSYFEDNDDIDDDNNDDDDDDDDDDISPRTSIGSNEDYSILRVTGYIHKRKKKPSFSSLPKDIEFAYNINSSQISSITSNEEFSSSNNQHPRRLFHAYNNGDEREYDRQLRQHYVLKHVLQGNVHVPIATDKPITILDSACGAGFWTLDMAQSFPNAKVIGLDAAFSSTTAAINNNNKQIKRYTTNTATTTTTTTITATMCAPNIVYKYGDPTTHLSLPDNYLDIIFQRDTLSSIPHECWPFLLNELMRVAKPGGSIELVEYDFHIKNPGPILTLINEWYKLVSTSVGINSKKTIMHLKSMLVSAGFQNIEQKIISIPIGEWPTEEDEKEKGFLYKHVIKALFKSMKPWWISELAISEEEYDKVIHAAMDEFDKQRCSIDWVIYTAQKPKEKRHKK